LILAKTGARGKLKFTDLTDRRGRAGRQALERGSGAGRPR
jgi:hypothetical protein